MKPASLRASLCDPDAAFPREALVWARDNAALATPPLLAMLSACAKPGDLTDREAVGGFYSAVMLAALREARAFPVFCALARNEDRLDELLRDFGIDYLHRLIVGIDGGDLDALIAVVKDKRVFAGVRASFLQAWTWHALEVEKATSFEKAVGLSDLFVGADDAVLWHEWTQTLIALDAAQAIEAIESAFARAKIDQPLADGADYRADAAAWREDPEGCRNMYLVENAPIGDPVAVLERWIDTLDQEQPSEDDGDGAPEDDDLADDGGDPAENPFRNVGRNDPCPCGSGKKFKKCCLSKVDAGLI